MMLGSDYLTAAVYAKLIIYVIVYRINNHIWFGLQAYFFKNQFLPTEGKHMTQRMTS